MTSNPPPYAPESKGLYPSVPPDPAQQPSVSYYAQPAGAPPPQQYPGPQVNGSQTPVVIQPHRPPQSFIVHIVVSFIICGCCASFFGLIAFILARKSKPLHTEA